MVTSETTPPAPDAPVNPSKRGKNRKFSHELFLRIIERIRNGAFTREAIAAEGIHHATFYDHLGDKSDYNDILKAAQLCGPSQIAESELFRRGVKGVLKPVYQGGKLVGKIREYSDTALIFYLKGAYPEKYREGADVRVQANVTASSVTMSPEAAAALAQASEENRRLLSEFRQRRGLPPITAERLTDKNPTVTGDST